MIYQKETIEWVTVGVECCSFIEQHQQLTRNELVEKALLLFPLLYLKTRLLPILNTEENIDDEAFLESFVTEVNYMQLRQTLADALGEYDDFLDTFHPEMDYSDTPIVSTISEEMADVYQCVKDTIANFAQENDEIRKMAIMNVREDFLSYWGQKLLNVMKALHEVDIKIREE